MPELTIDPALLPPGSLSHRSAAWWGMMAAIASEGALFVYLLFSYYYIAVQPHVGAWPPEPMRLRLSLPNTLILMLSSLTAWWAERGTRRNARLPQLLGLALSLALGAVFLVVQIVEWRTRSFSISSHAYGSLYFTITGFHAAHVVGGLLILAWLLLWSALGYFGRRSDAPVSLGVWYWHFVDAIWLTVFFTFYLTPHLGLAS